MFRLYLKYFKKIVFTVFKNATNVFKIFLAKICVTLKFHTNKFKLIPGIKMLNDKNIFTLFINIPLLITYKYKTIK